MREIVLDTETTGGSHKKGDRIVEIGLVEMIDTRPTGRVLHSYFDPQRDIHWAAKRVHGLSRDMLEGQPLFAEKAAEILDFIGDDLCLAHNSAFDQRFLRSELERAGHAPPHGNQWRDTIRLAEKALPGGPRKLDALVAHLGIETPDRKVHGALLDSAILAAVVARLRGAPDVDVESLVGQSEPWPTGGKAAQTTPEAPRERRDDTAPQRRLSAEENDAACRKMARAVSDAFHAAGNFREFLSGIEARGLRVRPNVDPKSGVLNGMRFRSDEIYMLSSEFGLNAKTFAAGSLTYDRARDRDAAIDYRERYTRDFGACYEDTVPQGRPTRSAEVMRITMREAVLAASAEEAASATRDNDIDPALAETIGEINSRPPSFAWRVYADLKSGQDAWSRVPERFLVARARETAPEGDPAFEAIMSLPSSDRKATLRWVCRGLETDHALCKLVVERRNFGAPLHPRVVETAIEVQDRRRLDDDRARRAETECETPDP